MLALPPALRPPLRTCAGAVLLWLAAGLAPTAAAAQDRATLNEAPVPALDRNEALRISQAAIGRTPGDHTLLDRDARPVRLSSFRGKPLVVSFIYTGCFQVCPTGTRTLQESLRSLYGTLGADAFRVVSIGFNQPADSPQAMRAFAAQQRIDAPNWDFLSAPPATVQALTREFGFRYVATPAGFDHVLGVTLVDAQGRIAAQVLGDRITPEQLGEPLRALLRDAPMPSQPTLEALLERVRVVCTVYDPETGTYRYAWGLILEIAGGVTFLLTMLVFFGLEAREHRRRRRAVRSAPGPAASPSR